MQIGVLIIGDEILSGRRQDKHLAYVIKTLAERNLLLSWARYVGDNESSLIDNFREIYAGGDLCFSFGGIGATPDDLTRQSIATALNLPITRNSEAVKEIESKFGDAAYPNRVLMADLPRNAQLIPNPVNRIPGFSLGHIHCLPGFPEMAWPMMKWVLENHYPDLRGNEIKLHRIKVHGAHESDLLTLMQNIHEAYPSIKLSSLPRFLPDGDREIELGVTGRIPEVTVAYDNLKKILIEQGYTISNAD